MKLQAFNITLENVKKSNYWDLIAILVWNHYSEKHYQDESKITIEEVWYGKDINGSGCEMSSQWNNPNHTREGCVRTLHSIKIIFTRNDYTTHININVNGNISCYGFYSKNDDDKYPNYHGAQRNLDITNWMLDNHFLQLIN